MDDVDEALRRLAGRRSAPLRIRVRGHPGVGARTLAGALRTRFRVDARCGPPAPDDDLICQVLGAGVRQCDREALAGYRAPVLVVAGRADQRGAPERAAALAGDASALLGRPVYPVAGLPGGARVSADDLEVLRGWAARGLRLPAMPAAFLDGVPAGERRRRATLLGRYGPAGLSRLLTALAAPERGNALDAAAATALLRAGSGLHALVGPLQALAPELRRRREHRYRAELSALAAAGAQRDRLEALAQRSGRG